MLSLLPAGKVVYSQMYVASSDSFRLLKMRVVSSSEGVLWRTAGFLNLTRSLKAGSTDTPRAGLAMATFCLVPLTDFCQVTWEIFTGGLLFAK